MRESAGPTVAPGQQGCPLEPNLTGDCGNLRYYNLCSGYIWIYASGQYHVGVRFDAACISSGNSVERAITYFRNVVPGYSQTVGVFLDVDAGNDGCPDYVLDGDAALDPGLRWNCTSFSGLCVPGGVGALIVRTVQNGGTAPNFATDGPFSGECDPQGAPHSYFYGFDGSICEPWVGPTQRADNFLYWLVIDAGCITSSEGTSWGAIKGLYR
jgi:hypothetical protein